MQFTLSPNTLVFQAEECRACLWHLNRSEWRKPSAPFPSIFGRIDKLMKGRLKDQCPQKMVSHGLPQGRILCEVSKLKSKPLFIAGHELVLTGYPDAVMLFNDGSHGVLDFKTSDPSPEKVAKYWKQLYSYAWMLEGAAQGSMHLDRVKHLWLYVGYPNGYELDEAGHDRLILERHTIVFPRDQVREKQFDSLLTAIVCFLAGPQPQMNAKCPYCKLRGY